MAVAQLAVVLARFNKSVVAVDLDVESPGLLYRMQANFGAFRMPRLGLVHHAESFEKSGKLINLSQIQVKVTPKLQLLIPGDPLGGGQDYWETLIRLGHFERPKARTYFKALKDAVETQLSPQYLLIDSPSGFSELAGLCNNLMADAVVTLTTCERDSLLGTNVAAIRREEREDLGHAVPKMCYALSRVPAYYENDNTLVRLQERELTAVVDEAMGPLVSGLNQYEGVKLRLIRSEPRLQTASILPIPLAGAPMQSAVVHDYCDLFSDILPELSDQLATLRSGVRVIRSYYLVQDAGLMINPADESLNVAFRVDTLLSFIDALVAGATSKSSPRAKKSGKSADKALFLAGYTAAKNFSEYLGSQWSKDLDHEAAQMTPQAKLQKWCEFDSSVGFGRFRGYLSGDTGEVVVNNNFLIAGRDSADQNLCGFMVGYITRILEVIYPDKRVVVTHDRAADCGQFIKHDPPECRFRFVAAKPARGAVRAVKHKDSDASSASEGRVRRQQRTAANRKA